MPSTALRLSLTGVFVGMASGIPYTALMATTEYFFNVQHAHSGSKWVGSVFSMQLLSPV